MSTRWLAWVVGIALCAAFGCSSSHRNAVGGETHWLAGCALNGECGGDQCICGLCTRLCAGDNECAGNRPAQCFDLRSPGLADSCGDVRSAPHGGLCAAVCKIDRDCPSGDRCTHGACVSKTSSARSTLGTGGASAGCQDAGCSAGQACVNGACTSDTQGTKGASLTCTRDDQCLDGNLCSNGVCKPKASSALGYLDLDAGVDLNQPIRLPKPETNIAGAADVLLGHWIQEECNLEGGACFNLVIESGPGGSGAIGYFYKSNVQNPDNSSVLGALTFAAATDPDVGYPRELDPTQYWGARVNGVAEHRYRLFDGKLAGDHFSVWWSYVDLWSDWCALQTPVLVQFGNAQRYLCTVSIDDEKVDLGKRALCTFSELGGLCDQQQPCVCVVQPPATNQSPLCSPTYCECDAKACRANPWAEPQWLDLTLVGQKLSGSWRDGWDGTTPQSLTFTKIEVP